MKRFSKMVSVMRETPLARVISAISCACRSVGKPGNGAVVTSTGRDAGAVARHAQAGIGRVISTPACASTSSPACSSSGARSRALRRRRSWPPPSHRCRSRCGRAARGGARRQACGTPSTTMREVPAPVIFAPILLRQSATSLISGSRAAFSITVVPLASEAAINAVCVPPTVTLGKLISPPLRPFLARAIT